MQHWLLAQFLVSTSLLAGASVHTDFEGGSLGRVEKLSDTHLRLGAKGERDQDGRNRQANWYYFRIDDAGTREITIDIVDLPGEYDYKPNRGAITKDTPPVISYDGKSWSHVTAFEYESVEPKLILRIRPSGPRFWIAHTPPYTGENLARLRHEIGNSPDFHERVIGKTLGGREMLLWSIGAPAPDKKTIWLMFRQHSWETGSSWAGEGAIRTLLGNGAQAESLRKKAHWKIFPLCDPDGVARGGVRFNANGYDLNRNWDVVDPLKMPEITAQRKAIRDWIYSGNSIDLFLSLHNTETAEYLQGPPEGSAHPQVSSLAQRFFNLLSTMTTFAPTRPLSYAEQTTTAGKKGRMMVIQGLYADFKLPGFLMEQRISFNPKLGRLPEISDRLQFGAQLVEVAVRAVEAAE